jgi:hypothetical protein
MDTLDLAGDAATTLLEIVSGLSGKVYISRSEADGMMGDKRRYRKLATALLEECPSQQGDSCREIPFAFPTDSWCHVRGGGRGYQNGGPSFANLSPRLSLFSDHLRTVLAVKGSLRRAQQRRALDGSGPFRTTLLRRGKGSLRTAPLAGDHFAAILVPFSPPPTVPRVVTIAIGNVA